VRNASLRLAFVEETIVLPRAAFFLKSRGTLWLTLGEPSGSPRPLPLVRYADKTLRAFPTLLHSHGRSCP